VTFLFHPEAEAEFNRAIDYYEEVEPGLGFDFAMMHLHRMPEYWKHRK
jgi:hypothetical protein